MDLPDEPFSTLLSVSNANGDAPFEGLNPSQGLFPLINIGAGKDQSIRELAELVSSCLDIKAELVWDESKPDGTKRKLLDTSRMRNLGWRPSIPLERGIRDTYRWYLRQVQGQ
jgi:nucleoside-diphosphate-sugar epimerase